MLVVVSTYLLSFAGRNAPLEWIRTEEASIILCLSRSVEKKLASAEIGGPTGRRRLINGAEIDGLLKRRRRG